MKPVDLLLDLLNHILYDSFNKAAPQRSPGGQLLFFSDDDFSLHVFQWKKKLEEEINERS